jgi:competence protein ComGC
MRHLGVTILEILIVLAVLVILAIFFVPHVDKPSEKHRITYCMENQREIATAISMYCLDNHDTYPPDLQTTAWSAVLADYNSGDFNCPTIVGKGTIATPEYGFNAALFGRATGAVVSPAATVLTADLAEADQHGNYAFTTTNYAALIDLRHPGGFVATCADGSAHFVKTHGDTVTAALQKAGLHLSPKGGLP